MKFNIVKKDNEIKITMEVNSVIEDFDYIKMIDFLYKNRDKKIDFNYSQEVTDEEKSKINGLFNEIYQTIQPINKEEKNSFKGETI